MEKQNEDKRMSRNQQGGAMGAKADPAYGLTAAILWALVFYSLSPMSRSAPAGMAARNCPTSPMTLSQSPGVG